MVVLAPANLQNCTSYGGSFLILPINTEPCCIMGDGNLGQMMEPVQFKDQEDIYKDEKAWATVGTGMKRKHNTITSIYIEPRC